MSSHTGRKGADGQQGRSVKNLFFTGWVLMVAALGMMPGRTLAADAPVAPQTPPPPAYKPLPPPVVSKMPLYVSEELKYPEDGFAVFADDPPEISKLREDAADGPQDVNTYTFQEVGSLFIVRVRRHDPADLRDAKFRLALMSVPGAKPITHEGLTGLRFERKEHGRAMRVCVFTIGSIDYELMYDSADMSLQELDREGDIWIKRWRLIPMPSRRPR